MEARSARAFYGAPCRDRAALEGKGVGFRSLTEGVDTTTPGGTLVFHLFGALAQFERDLIRERTRAGLLAAEARGRKGGRKPVISADKLARAQALIVAGLTVREAAARLKVGKTALYAAMPSATAPVTVEHPSQVVKARLSRRPHNGPDRG